MDVAQIVADNHNACRIHCYVSATAHSDSHIGFRQRGRIVDTIAHHGNIFAILAQAFNCVGFLLRQYIGYNMGNSGLLSNSRCCLCIVAGKHYNIDFCAIQRRDSSCRIRL